MSATAPTSVASSHTLLTQIAIPTCNRGERQIDRVPAEAIGARSDDHGGWLSCGHGRAGRPEFRNRVREQRYCEYDERRSERHSERSVKEWEWRGDHRPGDE